MEPVERESRLPGYDRQIFTNALCKLTGTFAGGLAINGEVLQRIGQEIPGYSGKYRPTTDDPECFWTLRFSTTTSFPQGEIALLFPWVKTNSSEQRYVPRPVVACVRGDVGVAQVDGLAQKVLQCLKEEIKKEREWLYGISEA